MVSANDASKKFTAGKSSTSSQSIGFFDGLP